MVPSSHRWSLFGGQRGNKPLPPPPPDPEDLGSDEAADSEVEFFTSDRRRLLPKSCPKAACRGLGRDHGQVNMAFQESWAGPAGPGGGAFSWPGREDTAAGRAGPEVWSPPPHRDPEPLCRKNSWHTSGPWAPGPKPQVPPRVPIPPKTKTLSPAEEDKPPRIPPRMPLVPPCPPRTPSPKSLPIYINGVMPPTQSFAANPKYVSRAAPGERGPPAAQLTPCIEPILRDGRKASTTHYILLPPGQGRGHARGRGLSGGRGPAGQRAEPGGAR